MLYSYLVTYILKCTRLILNVESDFIIIIASKYIILYIIYKNNNHEITFKIDHYFFVL